MIKKIVLIALIGLSLLATGCSRTETTNNDIIEIINKTNKISKFRENVLLNYAVDDTSIIASGDLKFDLKKGIMIGEFKVNINNEIINIPVMMNENKLYIKDFNNNYFYLSLPSKNLDLLIGNFDKQSIKFININDKDNKNLTYYRGTIITTNEFNDLLDNIGKVFYHIDDVKKISKVDVKKGIDKKDGYAYTTEINFSQILENNLVKDTSVIGVATLKTSILDLREEVTINTDELKDAKELTDIDILLDTYLTNTENE